MVKIVGFERKVGSFSSSPSETIAYDNHAIYILSDEDNNVVGYRSEQVKVKTAELNDIFGTTNLSDFLGKSVELKYSVKNAKVVLVKVSLSDSECDI